jgi:putative restriction endonuclease
MNRPDYWLGKFSKLRVDRARGDPAPHKPLLLLALCDLAESGDLRNVLPLSPEFAFRFYTYWNIVAGRRAQRPDIRLPFHHLSGDGIWSALDDRGELSPDKKLTKCARLPSDLIGFLEDPANRDKARHLLIAKYFRPSEQIALYEMIGLPVPSRQEIEANAASLPLCRLQLQHWTRIIYSKATMADDCRWSLLSVSEKNGSPESNSRHDGYGE